MPNSFLNKVECSAFSLLVTIFMVVTVHAENLPHHGEYVSDDPDGNYSITIQSADPARGVIKGTYQAKDSFEGPLRVDSDHIGYYAWVFSKSHGADGHAPFGIRFMAMVRPDNRNFNIYDSWVGTYQEDNTIEMTGSRSYVNHLGESTSLPLGTFTFKKQ